MDLKKNIKGYYTDLVSDKKRGALSALFLFLLLLFSFIYGFFVKLLLSCYRKGYFKSYKADCPVISIGNITWGGTGKTPLVETLARFLIQQGKHPAILIRGYGKDEDEMLKNKFKDIPVLVGRDRVKSARVARKRYAVDTIILDDGFQHWPLERDLDIVLIDAKLPFGNRRLIPRGILREPLSSLTRADVFVLTRANEAEQNIEPLKRELKHYNPQAVIYEAIHSPTFLRSLTSGEKIEISAIKNQEVAVVAGIARPQSFTNTLNLLGAKVSLTFYFPDHYQYSKEDLKKIEKACLEKKIKNTVTTEKDAARLTRLLRSERLKVGLLALGIEIKFSKDAESFFQLFKSDKHTEKTYSILILSDAKAGHLNQSKAIGRMIQKRKIEEGIQELNRKIVEVRFKNRFCRILLSFCSVFARPDCGRCLACLRFSLKKDSFRELIQSPANIIISAGSSLSSVNLFLSFKNSARNIVLMRPSVLNLNRFDLVIVPEHDRPVLSDNVLLTRIAPNLIDQKYLKEQADSLNTHYALRTTQYETQGPTIGVLIGGDTGKFRITTELMNKVVSQLKAAASTLNSQILFTTSRRTSYAAERLAKENLVDFARCKLLVIANEKNIPEAVGGILALSDIIVVSGESISMVSEAISAQKYVLVFMPEKKTEVLTKQERFLLKLEKEAILKIVQPENLASEIEKTWQLKPKKIKIEDREAISRAVSRIL